MLDTTFADSAENGDSSLNRLYAERTLQPSHHTGGQIFASKGARSEFGWLIEKAPEWAGCDLNFITDLDITGGVDPSQFDDTELEGKVREFVDANPSLFEHETEKMMGYFITGAQKFARYGADGARGYVGSEKVRSTLFIQSVSGRDFPKISEEGLGVPIEMSAFDDAAITIMHECGHLLKQHSHMDQAEGLRNETEAEGLAIASFAESVNEGRNLNPEALHPRLAFRSLQSIIWNGKRDIEKINDPLENDEGFFHGMSAALSLVDSPLTTPQAEALLKAPIQVNTLTHFLTGDTPDRSQYFSAMAALYSEGHFGQNTLAEVYVAQALQACQDYAGDWLDTELISDFRTKIGQTSLPNVSWDRTDNFFEPQNGRYIDPAVSSSDVSKNNTQFNIA